jgi:hypothetical protein
VYLNVFRSTVSKAIIHHCNLNTKQKFCWANRRAKRKIAGLDPVAVKRSPALLRAKFNIVTVNVDNSRLKSAGNAGVAVTSQDGDELGRTSAAVHNSTRISFIARISYSGTLPLGADPNVVFHGGVTLVNRTVA